MVVALNLVSCVAFGVLLWSIVRRRRMIEAVTLVALAATSTVSLLLSSDAVGAVVHGWLLGAAFTAAALLVASRVVAFRVDVHRDAKAAAVSKHPSKRRPRTPDVPGHVAVDLHAVNNGDPRALGRLWEHFFGASVDWSRPLSDLIAEVELALNTEMAVAEGGHDEGEEPDE